MNSKHIYFGMLAVITLLVIAIFGGAYLANGFLTEQSKKLVDLKMQDQVLEREAIGLAKAKDDIEKYSSLEKIAKAIVPQDKDQAKAVREIINMAAESGITPTSVTFPVSTLGTAAPRPVAGTTTTTTPAPTATPSVPQKISQLTPVKDIKGVYTLEITIQQDSSSPVTYDKFLNFLERLEKNRRTSQVTSIVLQPSSADRNLVSFTLTVEEFIKP